MKFATVSLLSFLVAAGVNAQLLINTPSNVVQCEPILLTWQGGQPPYFLSILPGGQPSASPIENLGQLNGTSLTWIANIAAGTSIGLTIRDSTGETQSSAPFNIIASSDSSCLGSSVSVIPGSSTSGATGTTASTTASTTGGVTTTPASSSTGTATVKSTSSTSSSSGSTTSTSSGASALSAQAGMAGLLGAFIAAVFA